MPRVRRRCPAAPGRRWLGGQATVDGAEVMTEVGEPAASS